MTISLVNKQLQELALQVFNIDELTSDASRLSEMLVRYSYDINRTLSRSTSAMFKLNIIR